LRTIAQNQTFVPPQTAGGRPDVIGHEKSGAGFLPRRV